MKYIYAYLLILIFGISSCVRKHTSTSHEKSGRLINFTFGEEFDHDSISIWNGSTKVFFTNYIAYMPEISGSSIEQDADIYIKVFILDCSLPITVCIGDQCESVIIDSSKSTVFVFAKALYDENNNLIIDSKLRHWPFHLFTK